MRDLAALLDRMPCTARRPRTVEELPGGLTNRNLKVTTPTGAVVVRISASKYGWTLWASIQHGASTMDFDFWSWGMEKCDRAVAEFDGSDFEHLLHDVQLV